MSDLTGRSGSPNSEAVRTATPGRSASRSADDGEVCDGSLTCGLLGHYEDRCPGCGEALYDGVCQFTYTTWRCSGCGATIDSRVLMPKQVHR